MYDTHKRLYKRYGVTAKPVEEATDARLASVLTVEWVIFYVNTKRSSSEEKLTVVQMNFCVKRLHVIRIRKVCESMRSDSR